MLNLWRCIVSCAALFLAVWTMPAAAQFNAVFEGNQTAICMSASGYDDNLALQGTGSVASSTAWTQHIFRSDGTGTANARFLNIFHSATSVGFTPVSESESSCTFTYTIAPGGVINLTLDDPCVSTILTGPAAGQLVAVSGVTAQLKVLNQRTVLVSTETTPKVETVTNLTTGFVTERICHRTSTRFRP
jgi:hypothetical protein